MGSGGLDQADDSVDDDGDDYTPTTRRHDNTDEIRDDEKLRSKEQDPARPRGVITPAWKDRNKRVGSVSLLPIWLAISSRLVPSLVGWWIW
jgi:hypothetical protein